MAVTMRCALLQILLLLELLASGTRFQAKLYESHVGGRGKGLNMLISRGHYEGSTGASKKVVDVNETQSPSWESDEWGEDDYEDDYGHRNASFNDTESGSIGVTTIISGVNKTHPFDVKTNTRVSSSGAVDHDYHEEAAVDHDYHEEAAVGHDYHEEALARGVTVGERIMSLIDFNRSDSMEWLREGDVGTVVGAAIDVQNEERVRCDFPHMDGVELLPSQFTRQEWPEEDNYTHQEWFEDVHGTGSIGVTTKIRGVNKTQQFDVHTQTAVSGRAGGVADAYDDADDWDEYDGGNVSKPIVVTTEVGGVDTKSEFAVNTNTSISSAGSSWEYDGSDDLEEEENYTDDD